MVEGPLQDNPSTEHAMSLMKNPLLSAAILTLAAIFTPASARADAYDDLRNKWAELTIADPSKVNMSDPVIAAQIAEMANYGQNRWSELNKSAGRTYLFDDATSTTDSEHLVRTYRYLHAIAVAVRYDSHAVTPNKLGNVTQVKADLISALDWMYANRYQNNSVEYDNWWDWEIGVPQHLTNIVAIMWSDLTPTQRDNYTKAILAKVETSLTDYGANGTWQTKIWALIGILRKNVNATGGSKDYLAEARDRINNLLSVPFTTLPSGTWPKCGMYDDGSFIEHIWHPYNGSYGVSYIGDLASMHYLLKGSSWQTNLNNVTNHVVPWIFEAYDQTMYKRMFFDSVMGRTVDRVTQTYDGVANGSGLAQAALRTIEAAPSHVEREQLRALLAQWQTENASATNLMHTTVDTSIHDYSHAIQFMTTHTPRSALNSYKQFPWMNRAFVHRPNWGASLAMYTNNETNGRLLTLSNETLQGETLKGRHLSDGRLQIMNNDFGQYNKDYYTYLDWSRLPGTTVAYSTSYHTTPTDGTEERRSNNNNWAGGVGVSPYGVSGFHLNPNYWGWYGYLQARKAYFFFDQEILCLGTEIRTTNSSETKPIHSVIENQKLNQSGNNAFVVNGVGKPVSVPWSESLTGVNWAWLQGMASGADTGYYFPTAASFEASRRVSSHPNVKFMELYINHGVLNTGSNRSYGYAILPAFNQSQTQNYAAAPPITVLENSADAQAAWKTTLGVTGTIFWKNISKTVSYGGGSVIKSNKSAAVMVHKTAGKVKIAISNPTWDTLGTGTIEFWPNCAGNVTSLVSKDTAVTVLQQTPTLRLLVNLDNAKGKAIKAEFNYTP